MLFPLIERESPTALLVEGATQAPIIDERGKDKDDEGEREGCPPEKGRGDVSDRKAEG
jgi:hypothetical protein